jgi:putative DNA methylase
VLPAASGAAEPYVRPRIRETAGLKKLDNYQNFAKAFRVASFQPLLASVRPNDARLKSARELGASPVRAVLYPADEIDAEVEADEVMSHMRDNVPGYFQRRSDIVVIAGYLAAKLDRLREGEAAAARVLRDLVKSKRLGA